MNRNLESFRKPESAGKSALQRMYALPAVMRHVFLYSINNIM